MDEILNHIEGLNDKKKNDSCSNFIGFYFGKKINEEIFNSSKKNIKTIYDIIPLINSLFNSNIKEFNISKNKNIYLNDEIFNIKTVNDEKKIKIYNKYILDYKIYKLPFENNNNDLLIKEYLIKDKNTYLFKTDIIYNYKEYYTELEWILTFNMKIIVKIFKKTNSYTFYLETDNSLFSNNEIKKIKIFLDNIEKILFIY